MLIDNIDFAALYQQQLRQAKRSEKSPQYWDSRAVEMAVSCARPDSPYLQQLLSRIDFTGATTLLDAGCGPGTVCLHVASRLQQVWGIDYSAGMLAVARQKAAAMGLNNVTLLHRAWEDSWHDVPVCDIAVASRSTLVGDLRAAMLKLNQHARLWVVTTHSVSGFFGSTCSAGEGNKDDELPNYIYAVNVLWQMGIQAQVDFIRDPAHRDWAVLSWQPQRCALREAE
ncbi:class I SAM-dependent methyltransferase [Erwinia mallotivora]|uniref:Methyltransferase n=1 Tax=Erwinia mallotivora TaxID=69222 RepID=A0A014MFW5_9GAMM|nr:class I SAM-dependent methyltransferase [Erwinia mallotivora]EXU76999.1 methyltransferase [Erwinia mallotivora]